MTLARRVLITGAAGQVGRELMKSAPSGIELCAVTRDELDVGDEVAVREYVTNCKPELIINAAAYTAVDRAESEPVEAARCNESGAHNLAAAAARLVGTRVIHISTDFVFDGRASVPYTPDDAPMPLGVYGRTKLAGERAVVEALGTRALIVRTAWVYASHGCNFLRTMMRLMNERKAVRVVDDQLGTPTSARSLARVLWMFADRSDLCGVFHWTNAGVASWYDFALAIAEEAAGMSLLHGDVSVMPIASSEYPTVARRPSFSVLDKRSTISALQLEPDHWRVELRSIMREMAIG